MVVYGQRVGEWATGQQLHWGGLHSKGQIIGWANGCHTRQRWRGLARYQIRGRERHRAADRPVAPGGGRHSDGQSPLRDHGAIGRQQPVAVDGATADTAYVSHRLTSGCGHRQRQLGCDLHIARDVRPQVARPNRIGKRQFGTDPRGGGKIGQGQRRITRDGDGRGRRVVGRISVIGSAGVHLVDKTPRPIRCGQGQG